jgi:hypothetical protein
LESSLTTHDEKVENALTNSGDSSDEDTSIRGPGLVDTKGLVEMMIYPWHGVTPEVT